MTAPTTEVLIFEANDDFRRNPDLLIPAFDIALKAKGVHAPAYYGKQINKPSTRGYIILNWVNYEAHKALIDGPDYPAIGAAIQPCLAESGKLDIYHARFSAPTIALENPVTEIVLLTLKAPENREAVVEILTKLSEASEKTLVFGQMREDENRYILLGGWPSIEAPLEKIAQPVIAATLEKLYSLATRDHLYFAKLSQYRL